MLILSKKTTLTTCVALFVLLMVAMAIARSSVIKSRVDTHANELQLYLEQDIRHLSSVDGCLRISFQDDPFSVAHTRECILSLLEYRQPYHSLLALAAVVRSNLDMYPNDHVLRTKMLMAIAVTRAYEERINEQIFNDYYRSKLRCATSWVARSVLSCEQWFDRPKVRENNAIMHDLFLLENQFAHKDLDDLLYGYMTTSEAIARHQSVSLPQD